MWKVPLATETEPRELVVKTASGKVWPKELIDEMDTELYSRLYAAMGDELRTRMTDKFDKEGVTGKLPKATELLRYIVSKIQMVDPRAQERKANADLESHLNTSMPPAAKRQVYCGPLRLRRCLTSLSCRMGVLSSHWLTLLQAC